MSAAVPPRCLTSHITAFLAIVHGNVHELTYLMVSATAIRLAQTHAR